MKQRILVVLITTAFYAVAMAQKPPDFYNYRPPYERTDTTRVLLTYIDGDKLYSKVPVVAICTGTVVPSIYEGEWTEQVFYDYCEYKRAKRWLLPDIKVLEVAQINLEETVKLE